MSLPSRCLIHEVSMSAPEAADSLEHSFTLHEPAEQVLLSWNAHLTDSEHLSFAISSEQGWLELARWSPGQGQSTKSPGLAVDVLTLKPARRELRLRVQGAVSKLRRLALAPKVRRTESARSHSGAVFKAIPELSQRAVPPGDDAHRLCSPSSISMLLGALGQVQSPRAVADAVYDSGAQIFGNWSFNVAYAGHCGVYAVALWLESLDELEALCRGGWSLALSHRFDKGQLPESPLPETRGHLIVLRGFTEAGDVVVNDPAADPRKAEPMVRVYPRAAFSKSWGGLVYALRPETG